MKLLLYKLSIIVLLSSQGMDIGSSWNKPEANPLLSSHSGRFGVRGVSIKLGVVTGVLISQKLIIREKSDVQEVCTALNLVTGGVTLGAAVRNFSVKRDVE